VAAKVGEVLVTVPMLHALVAGAPSPLRLTGERYTTSRFSFSDLQLVAKSAFTNLRLVGKGFTNVLWVVCVNGVGKGFTNPPLLPTDRGLDILSFPDP
jgi:hypothetical protein